MKTVAILICCVMLFPASRSTGQRVLYSPAISKISSGFEVIGKAGDYYWVKKSTRKSRRSQQLSNEAYYDSGDKYEIYNSRMVPTGTLPFLNYSGNIIKEYFIPAEKSFDRLLVKAEVGKTFFVLERFMPDGTPVFINKTIDSLNIVEDRNNFLLARSEDQHRLLLLGFESSPGRKKLLHTILFDNDWNVLVKNDYAHSYITQPLIQYDYANYPLEAYANSPVKLADNGQWLMVTPSRTNSNYLLLHFKGSDSTFTFSEIKLAPSSTVVDIVLSVDNKKSQATAGLLTRMKNPDINNTTVADYSLDEKKFLSESTFRFTTVRFSPINEENVVEESFVSVPQKGFMLLKEYGRKFRDASDFGIFQPANYKEQDLFIVNHVLPEEEAPQPVNFDWYTKYPSLSGLSKKPERGDLSMYYFPVNSKDSSWSGLIKEEQTTELNSANLSYMVLPLGNRIYFLYNKEYRNGWQYASTTILDDRGNFLNEGGVVFSRLNRTLDFQKARLISETEVAVPYNKDQRPGFAVIRL